MGKVGERFVFFIHVKKGKPEKLTDLLSIPELGNGSSLRAQTFSVSKSRIPLLIETGTKGLQEFLCSEDSETLLQQNTIVYSLNIHSKRFIHVGGTL